MIESNLYLELCILELFRVEGMFVVVCVYLTVEFVCVAQLRVDSFHSSKDEFHFGLHPTQYPT